MEVLLQLSVDQYEKMAQLLRNLQHQLGEHTDEYIEDFNLAFGELQGKVEQIDQQLSVRLTQADGVAEKCAQRLIRKQELLFEIKGMLDLALPKAMNIRSLLASEIQSLKKGRNALSGYRNNSSNQGRLINKKT